MLAKRTRPAKRRVANTSAASGFTILYKPYKSFLQNAGSLRTKVRFKLLMLPRVLLAQDDEGPRLSLWNRLRLGGFNVETAADGLEGLTKAISGGFHLLILDAALPRVSGLDVCRALR
jgi:PleD family two-component response regulator